MADTTTTNLLLTKPEVGASTDTWGTKINTDLDGVDAVFAADGTGTSVGLNIGSGKKLKLVGDVIDTNGNELLKVTATASAVNELTLANAAAGGAPVLSATGGDTNIGITITPKGTGGVVFPAGAVGTPAITTTGDLNTGVFFPAADTLAIATGGSERVRVSSTGGFGVGTTTDPGAGAIYATGNITAFFSDDRLKTRLGNIENALDKVKTLTGFYYEANQTAQELGYEPMRDVGVSAQQVQAVLPEIVVPAPISEKYLTVRYEKLVPLLIEAIKELDNKIQALKLESK